MLLHLGLTCVTFAVGQVITFNVNFYKNADTFETKFARHVSVVQRPSSVESRIDLSYI